MAYEPKNIQKFNGSYKLETRMSVKYLWHERLTIYSCWTTIKLVATPPILFFWSACILRQNSVSWIKVSRPATTITVSLQGYVEWQYRGFICQSWELFMVHAWVWLIMSVIDNVHALCAFYTCSTLQLTMRTSTKPYFTILRSNIN